MKKRSHLRKLKKLFCPQHDWCLYKFGKKMNYVEDVDGKFNFLNLQVVIIGAGLSGLRAAKELIKKGITSIKIVEARNVKN
jgi:heterodisulfide reductase subunit A-like polyferredoxin